MPKQKSENSKRKFRTALITGITGSGGSYLADYIIEHHPKVSVHGISRWHSTSANENLKKAGAKVVVHECDLNDLSSVTRVMKLVKPDVIFHLAAHANVRASFDTPLAVVQNNVMGTANLLEAVRLSDIDPVVQICSTSEVYGQVDPKYVPITEDCPINPSSPYAVSKVAQDLLGYTYFKNFGTKIIRTRMFAYLNPRRADLFATAFARQVARIEAGLQKELLHGNLASTRTLIDVRDAMESYWIAAEKCAFGEAYNIGGNTVITVGEFLDLLKKKAKVKIPSRVDPKLLRPTDVTLQIPDTSKFAKTTGWKPKYSFEDSVEFLLEHCRRGLER
ncbi:MAG: GDP-mannose 4,6-dehydratase [Candidatus Sungbacteria bacterium]|nr:GDP-mannose 4,6-dehydratase [Candidatus Sungbacteria bacterium]